MHIKINHIADWVPHQDKSESLGEEPRHVYI